MPRLKLTLSARQLVVAAALALIANAASAAPPLEGLTGYALLFDYDISCYPPEPTAATALLDGMAAKIENSTKEQRDDARRQADAIFENLGTARFCREMAAALNEPSLVADAGVLDQLINLKARYAAAKGNDLLRESIVKQSDALCSRYRFVDGWSGSLAEVRRSGSDISISIQLDDKTTALSSTKLDSPITAAVAAIVPGTRVRFSGSLYLRGECGFKDEFRIDLDRITQDK